MHSRRDPKTPPTRPYDEPTAWCDSLDVFEKEWQSIDRRRAGAGEPPRPRATHHSPGSLAALALSGGGIRSATFNLGVLQALDRHRLLSHFDYLSTVSGGGYIGGWWTAWLSRPFAKADAAVFPPAEGIETWRHQVRHSRATPVPTPPTPDPVHHIRLFSNYLIPRSGVLSRDLWLAATIVARNLVLSWAALLPFLVAAVALAQGAFLWAYGVSSTNNQLRLPPAADRIDAVADVPLMFLVWFGVLALCWLLAQRGTTSRLQGMLTVGALMAVAYTLAGTLPVSSGPRLPIGLVVSSAVIAIAAYRTIGARLGALSREMIVNWLSKLQSVALACASTALLIGVVAAYGADVVRYLFFTSHAGWEQLAVDVGKYGALATSAVSAVFAAIKGRPVGGGEAQPAAPPSMASRLLLGLAPPLTLLVLFLATAWGIDWVVRTLPPTTWVPLFRDVTLIGALAMAGFAWTEPRAASAAGRDRYDPWIMTATMVAVLMGAGGALGRDYLGLMPGPGWASDGGSVALALAGGALLMIRYARLGHARTQAGANPRIPTWRFDRAFWLLAAACATAFVPTAIGAGLLVPPNEVRLLLGLCGLLFTIVMLIGWTTDPNTLSLHNFYKMRLVRAYLGASNPARTAQGAEDVTAAKPDDDILLKDVAECAGGAPYHLINATLNLTTGSDLVVAQRAAAPFLFSRHFCGSPRTGFRHTARYRSGTITLGSAVAISGAAASPVMGSQTPSTAMSMLLAFLNVRLGYWLPTPNKMDWQAPQARLWPFYLLREFFSHLADTGSYCYVTDGGHFDNTGVYTLIERGCRTIVLTDCGADPGGVFDDLSNLVRRCRIDFGVEISFKDLTPLTRATVAEHREPFVVGDIDYPASHLQALGEDGGNRTGTLIVVKPTLAARLDTDVNRYSQQHADFPQEPTADQFFDEAQFESYRRLGEQSGDKAAAEVGRALLGAGAAAHRRPEPPGVVAGV